MAALCGTVVRQTAFVDKLTYLRMHWTCESCEYSSSSSSSDGDSGDEMTSSAESLAELEIPVRVGGCEKWITGLTKRTTCDDVIYALLSNESNANDILDLQTFVMYERWREVERPLKGRTKILKVWRAWGPECRNVKFFIRKSENAYDSGSEILRTKRHSKRHSGYGLPAQQSASHNHQHHHHRESSSRRQNRDGHRHQSHDRERSRRRSHALDTNERRSHKHSSKSTERYMQRRPGFEPEAIPSCAKYPSPDDQLKAFDKTEDNTKDRFFRHMVQLIIDRERKLQDQSTRIKNTDKQIEAHETRLHMLRMEKDGRNYVQDTYLHEKSEESSSCASTDELRTGTGPASEKDMEDYIAMCEKIINMQDKITKEEVKIDELSSQIVNESQLDWDNHSLASGYSGCEGGIFSGMSVLKSHLPKEPERPLSGDVQLREEIEKLRQEVARSAALSIAQQKQLKLVDQTLGECEVQLQRKRLLVNQLLVEADETAHETNTQSDQIHVPLSKFKSKSCESIAETLPSDLHAIEPCHKTDDVLFSRRDNRAQYNSDSGVESVDNKQDNNFSIRSEINVDDVPYVRTVAGKSMVPYFTYATFDKEDRARPPFLPPVEEKSSIMVSGKSTDDSNSDTGLSSLHSDEQSPILETLV